MLWAPSVFAFSTAISIYHTYTPTANIMKMEIGAMALCSLSAATAFVAPSAFTGSQIARVQRTSGESEAWMRFLSSLDHDLAP